MDGIKNCGASAGDSSAGPIDHRRRPDHRAERCACSRSSGNRRLCAAVTFQKRVGVTTAAWRGYYGRPYAGTTTAPRAVITLAIRYYDGPYYGGYGYGGGYYGTAQATVTTAIRTVATAPRWPGARLLAVETGSFA